MDTGNMGSASSQPARNIMSLLLLHEVEVLAPIAAALTVIQQDYYASHTTESSSPFIPKLV
jgi:hypothetical protein